MNPLVAVFPGEVLEQLGLVEHHLQEQAASREPRLEAWTAEPLASGGKRIRPLLLLTAFHACGGANLGAREQREAIDAGVALELIHTASLVHDDLMDEADKRRGRPSTYAAHGVEGAILVGDYLFTQAFALAARLPKAALELTADACRRLCEGQLREQAFQEQTDPTPEDRQTYLSVIRDKTSALLAGGCGIGATLAKADPERIARMTQYGEAIGNAFQVLDDVLDITGDPKWTGKPAGTDYLAGTMSSPFLNHLERGGTLPEDRKAEDFPAVRDELFDSGAIAVSQLEASGHTQAALLALEGLEDTPAKQALSALAELLMERSL